MKGYKYKICLHKQYFDLGYGITSYAKYFIALFGAYSVMEKVPLKLTLFLLVGYMFFCYAFGWAWIRFGWFTASIEVGNTFNLFVKEMRKVYKPVVPK